MKITLLSGALALLTLSGFAQQYELVLDNETPPEIKVTGTSTLHDWTVTSSEVEQVPNSLSLNTSGEPLLEDFGFKVEIVDLDGGRGASMNSKIKAAFKSDANPYITFKQTKIATKTSSAQEIKFTSTGQLSMAGEEHEVNVEVTATKQDGHWQFSGRYPMNMSDFSMEKPTAMFGQIKTHDPVVVHFTFNYQIK